MNRIHRRLRLGASIPLLLLATPMTLDAQRPADVPYRNTSLPVDTRLDDLVDRMTLEEKIGQMMSIWQAKDSITGPKRDFDPSAATAWFRTGIGRIERASEGRGARAQAGFANAVQRWVRDSTRLGIPVLFHEEALHGLMAPEATSFPQSIALASTWNPDLVERVFQTVALEVRARGAHQVLAPVVDVARDPRWGRIEETFGEDPYLTARLGVAAVMGFQGPRPVARDRVLATLKHLAGHGQPESGTNIGPASLGERTLREVFLYPFEVAVREAAPSAVMASYNEIDGVPSHVNRWMLGDVLRGEWGFDGAVVSDWFAIDELMTRHRLTDDRGEAARRAFEAGVDLELPDVSAYPALVEHVRAGEIPEAAIDAAIRRLLRVKFELGLFEDPFVDPDRADRLSGAEAHRALALEAARQSLVLLKNEPALLPLDPAALGRIAVIGPHAGEIMLGGYSGVPRQGVSILDGIRRRAGSGVTVEYAEGVRLTEDSVFTNEPQPHLGGSRSHLRWNIDAVIPADSASNAHRIGQAAALAARSDLAILVLGDNAMTSREGWSETHLGDRSSLDLPGPQERLVREVLATGTPVVVVLQHGRPAAIPGIVETVPAILEAWYAGQEAGTAVAEALFGDINPGGKLPVTVPRDVGQLPVFYDHKPSARRGYLFDTVEPLFPFGHGLSYTRFELSPPRLSAERIHVDGALTVAVDVTNAGDRTGDEVVQLYVRDLVSEVTRPVLQLRGFSRITLEPGARRTVELRVGPEELAYHGPEMARVVEPGTFELCTGASSANLRCVALEVVGTVAPTADPPED